MKLFLIALLVAVVSADVYMHNPRGGNDRLNENNGNRQNANRLWDSQNNAAGGYTWGPAMYFYAGSKMPIEWSNQHGCGNEKANCQIILQYTCDNIVGEAMRDGTTTTTVPDNAATQSDPKYGRHETYEYYQECKTRERNKGLFIADRNVGGAARNTRQNNGGTRSGFECPEERDYYPYWHSSPWIDIAVLTDDESRCKYYQEESQNVKPRNYCSDKKANNEASCKQAGAEWKEAPAHNEPAPDCLATTKTFVNHLGRGVNGQFSKYDWTIPDKAGQNCILRLRYNISTGDYDGWNTDAKKNAKASPVTQDKTLDFNGNLSLAMNTNQYGRTFQDRTHLWSIKKRPDSVPANAVIHNLNVRGKRGNIVQSYPAVEYDMVPNRLETKEGEYVHYQWTGGNTNGGGNGNNNGEGTQDTDRNNICQMEDLSKSTCMKFNKAKFFEDEATRKRMAHIDQKNCLSYDELRTKNNNNNGQIEQDVQNCMKLNGAADGYFDGGLLRMNKTGEYFFMTTRNNNFSNRSQKSTVVVDPPLPLWAAFLIGIGGGMLALGGAGAYAYHKGQLPFFNGPSI